MIVTEEQRRWWFATHPEYSHHNAGTRDTRRGDDAHRQETIDPRDVIAYADEALKYVTDPIVIAILRSLKRQAAELMHKRRLQAAFDEQKHHTAHEGNSPKHDTGVAPTEQKNPTTTLDESTFDSTAGDPDRGADGRTAESREIIERDKMGLEPDPITALDVIPLGRFVTAPAQALRALLNRLAKGQVVSAVKKGGGTRWKVGDDPLAPTAKGDIPSWATQCERRWKNEAAKPGALEKWGETNLERMNRGRGAQRKNPNSGRAGDEGMAPHPNASAPWRHRGNRRLARGT
ncbi:MAG: hypothetical protein AB1646_26725 [Thermodesulfobacteriota bacterium]